MFTVRRLALLSCSATLALGLVACSSSDYGDTTSTSESATAESALVVYSGRGEELVDPLIERIGGGIEVDYSGNTNAQAAKILEEGDATPAGGTIAFSDFDNSGYRIDTSVDINGRSAEAPIEPPSTAAANVPTEVTCEGDVLTTHPEGTPFTTTWSRVG